MCNIHLKNCSIIFRHIVSFYYQNNPMRQVGQTLAFSLAVQETKLKEL